MFYNDTGTRPPSHRHYKLKHVSQKKSFTKRQQRILLDDELKIGEGRSRGILKNSIKITLICLPRKK